MLSQPLWPLTIDAIVSLFGSPHQPFADTPQDILSLSPLVCSLSLHHSPLYPPIFAAQIKQVVRVRFKN